MLTMASGNKRIIIYSAMCVQIGNPVDIYSTCHKVVKQYPSWKYIFSIMQCIISFNHAVWICPSFSNSPYITSPGAYIVYICLKGFTDSSVSSQYIPTLKLIGNTFI